MSHSCNDFIIKGGVFIRDFDGMYQSISDPWNQESHLKADLMNNFMAHSLDHLKSTHSFKPTSILNIGCATGYELHLLSKIFEMTTYAGTDVSKTAIEKAREQKFDLPQCNIEFKVDDITKHNKDFEQSFDLIYSSKTLYYVAPEIDQVLKSLKTYLRPGGRVAFGYNITPDAFTKNGSLIYL